MCSVSFSLMLMKDMGDLAESDLLMRIHTQR